MRLVIDSGTYNIKAGLFADDRIVQTCLAANPDQLMKFLKDQKIESCLLAAKDPEKSRALTAQLTAGGVPCTALNPADFKKMSGEDVQTLLQPDQIAHIFGALTHFPSNDCIIVDLGTEVRFDYVSKHGIYLGGAVFPSVEALFSALEKTPFPDLGGQDPLSLGKTRLDQSKSGCYFGTLGAIERIVAELRLSSETPSAVMTVATGGLTSSPHIKKDLEDFIDRVDPFLTMIGLNQILQEH
jgi:type III pantothenate kinase